MTPRELGESLKHLDGKIAVVFGREGSGLSNRELDKCDIVLTIPASPAYPTLNISRAAATIFYELYISSSQIPTEVLADFRVKKKILDLLRLPLSR